MSTLLEERPITRDPEVTVRVVTEEARRGGRRGGGGGGRTRSLLHTAGLGAIAVAILLIVGSITGLVNLGGVFSNTETTTSTQVLLKQLKNLSSYNAAQGVYQVDITQHTDVPVLPNFLAGETIVYRAIGSVDAQIDFGVLATDAVQRNGDAVTITLAPPTFGKAVVDPERSKVISWSRGLFTRIGGAITGDPDLDRSIYAKADKQITKAAHESGLIKRAKANTENMLKGFLGRLGFTNVTITWSHGAGTANDAVGATTKKS